jgi:hypothetical protein
MPNQVRLDADADRLRALAAASRGKIGIVALPAPGSPRFALDLGYAIAGSAGYPADRRTHTRLVIDLPARYPFMPPAARIATPIFHPNVYPSGLVCLGTKWLPSEGMDLFVRRIAQLITFDPLIVNLHSVANAAALRWYQQALRRAPHAFPTERVELALAEAEGKSVGWRDSESAGDARVNRACPHCGASLRLPAGRRGTVRCPKCSGAFEAAT